MSTVYWTLYVDNGKQERGQRIYKGEISDVERIRV